MWAGIFEGSFNGQTMNCTCPRFRSGSHTTWSGANDCAPSRISRNGSIKHSPKCRFGRLPSPMRLPWLGPKSNFPASFRALRHDLFGDHVGDVAREFYLVSGNLAFVLDLQRIPLVVQVLHEGDFI